MTQEVPEESRALDRYESKYMVAGSPVLAHERVPARWQYHATFGLIAAILLLKASTLLVAGVAMAGLAAAWLFFSGLRVAVTAEAVDIKLGLFGPRIPLKAIRSATATAHNWTDFRGAFIRTNFWRRETLYALPGTSGKALRLEWTNGRGKQRTTVVACRDPGALAKTIRRLTKNNALAAAHTSTALPTGESSDS